MLMALSKYSVKIHNSVMSDLSSENIVHHRSTEKCELSIVVWKFQVVAQVFEEAHLHWLLLHTFV